MDNLALDIVHRWNSEEARKKMIFAGDRQEAECYLQAVDEIQRSYDESAIAIAMSRLRNEFRNILISRANPTSFLHHLNTEEEKEEEPQQGCCAGFSHRRFNGSPSAKRHDAADELLSFVNLEEMGVITFSVDAINDLRCIAERMISSGYLWQCIEVYGTVRKSIIDATLQRLGIGYVQRDQLPPDTRIHIWREAARVSVLILFAREKRLCEEIFEGVGPDIAHASFMETAKEAAIQLLKFADAIFTSTTSSPQKLFRILDLYQALADLIPHFDNIFDHKSCYPIRILAADVLSCLSEAARDTFFQFENSVLGDTSESEIPIPANGIIHPLTIYVMDNLSFICDYKQTLDDLIVPKPSMESIFTPDKHFAQEEGETRLTIYLTSIIETLLIKLDGKCKQYKVESLSHLFTMNNAHYIFKRVRGHSKLRDIIGDGYLKKLERKFQQAAISYEKSTWGRVLECLTEEGLYLKKGGWGRVFDCLTGGGLYLKKGGKMSISNLKAFTVLFEKVHRTQAVWSIPDLQLRSSLQMSITQKLIPAYKSFVRRHGNIKLGYVKYSELDLNAAVLDLFKGKSIS
ncbi:exocyst complex component EXO70A1-like [Abrus precatorius]|uniref:Exocyst subunit Exo70 family protein n=1 Tax=Abrus precatorius TaxID=3816 RepID=A0A8B8KQ90_ABRPR|nr:exocyst complex component EXO70A1-like [Abrus precatorius]